MIKINLQFSTKFYLGIFFIILSLVIGKIVQFTFFAYFNDHFIRWISVIIYILSWIPFILGIWWVGREYAAAVQKYFSLKFYRESAKKGARKAVHETKNLGKKVGHKTKQAGKKITGHIKKKIKKKQSLKK